MFVSPLTALFLMAHKSSLAVTDFGLGRSLYTMTLAEKNEFMRVRDCEWLFQALHPSLLLPRGLPRSRFSISATPPTQSPLPL